MILLTSTWKQAIYLYILEQSLASGKTEIRIIKELFEIKKFYDAYRKWKERYRAKGKNKSNKLTENKMVGVKGRDSKHWERVR